MAFFLPASDRSNFSVQRDHVMDHVQNLQRLGLPNSSWIDPALGNDPATNPTLLEHVQPAGSLVYCTKSAKAADACICSMQRPQTKFTLETRLNGSIDLNDSSVALSGNDVMVGAPRSDPNRMGAAYVYLDPGCGEEWAREELNNPNPAEQDYFGHSVAIDGRWALVGAPMEITARAEKVPLFEIKKK